MNLTDAYMDNLVPGTFAVVLAEVCVAMDERIQKDGRAWLGGDVTPEDLLHLAIYLVPLYLERLETPEQYLGRVVNLKKHLDMRKRDVRGLLSYHNVMTHAYTSRMKQRPTYTPQNG